MFYLTIPYDLAKTTPGKIWPRSQDTHGLHAKIPAKHMPEADVPWPQAGHTHTDGV